MNQQPPLIIHIEGMSCAACVGRAQDALQGVAGVETAQVNLASETGLVQGRSVVVSELVSALDRAGYPAATETIELTIEGMHCGACVGRVEQALVELPTVLNASVNLLTETAEVRMLAGAAQSDVFAAVADSGYSAKLKAGSASTTDRKAAQQRRLRRMLLIAACLTLPVFVLEMGGHLLPQFRAWVDQHIGAQSSRVIQFLLTTAVLAWPGSEFLRKGFPALLRRAPDMNSLVALGATAAWGYSVIATFFPSLLPAGARAVYFEAAALIVTLILLGRFLEARARGRTGEAIAKLVELRPETALVIRDAVATELPLDRIGVGDEIQVRPGERIAIDGEVTEGSSFVDESMVTGEPVAVKKSVGDGVIGGTINGRGALKFRVARVGQDTMLAQIIALVEQAQGARLPIQSLVNRITAWFVPVVMVIAALTILVWLLLGPAPVLSHALVAGVAVLIIACPCAMGLATPTSIMVGTGRAAQMGVLFRKGDALQSLQATQVIALDKTGTLTAGKPQLTHMTTVNGFEDNEVLRLVASAEQLSEHPVAEAIVAAAKARELALQSCDAFDTITGAGIRARVDGHEIVVGADRLLQQHGMMLGELEQQATELANKGQTPLFAAIDGTVAALIVVADPIRPTTPEAIASLQAAGFRVAMITGDNQNTASAIAGELGIDHVVAEVLPDAKVAAIAELRGDDTKVAFVGDGINDAPALAAADTGIAIGSGTDVAIESADVVLMSGDLRGVVNALEISRRTMTNIRQNLFWAFAYNVLLIPIAAGLLYPVNGMMLSPALAAGAMALSSVFVLTNALRLRFVKPTL